MGCSVVVSVYVSCFILFYSFLLLLLLCFAIFFFLHNIEIDNITHIPYIYTWCRTAPTYTFCGCVLHDWIVKYSWWLFLFPPAILCRFFFVTQYVIWMHRCDVRSCLSWVDFFICRFFSHLFLFLFLWCVYGSRGDNIKISLLLKPFDFCTTIKHQFFFIHFLFCHIFFLCSHLPPFFYYLWLSDRYTRTIFSPAFFFILCEACAFFCFIPSFHLDSNGLPLRFFICFFLFFTNFAMHTTMVGYHNIFMTTA